MPTGLEGWPGRRPARRSWRGVGGGGAAGRVVENIRWPVHATGVRKRSG